MKIDQYVSCLTHDKSNAIFRAEYAMEQFKHLKLPSRLLDVGCGSGELLRTAKSQGVTNVSGVDGVQDALEQCKDIQGEIHKVDLNSEDLPFTDGSFNGVTCMEVLEHLYAPQNTLKEIYRVLENGNWAIISVPNPYTYSMRAKIVFGGTVSDPSVIGGHIKFFRPHDLLEMCSKTGFRKIRISGLAYSTAYQKSRLLANLLVSRRPEYFATWLFACCQK